MINNIWLAQILVRVLKKTENTHTHTHICQDQVTLNVTLNNISPF